jgi:hypothetical protein
MIQCSPTTQIDAFSYEHGASLESAPGNRRRPGHECPAGRILRSILFGGLAVGRVKASASTAKAEAESALGLRSTVAGEDTRISAFSIK